MEPFNVSDYKGIHVKTHNPTIKYTLKWMIVNYSTIEYGNSIQSPRFSIEHQSEWFARFTKQNSSISFYIFRSCEMFPVKINYTFTVNDSEGKEYFMVQEERSVNSKEYALSIDKGSDCYWKNIVNLMNTAKNDTLIFTILIEVSSKYVTEMVTRFEVKEDVTRENLQKTLFEKLSSDLKKILDSRTKPDLVLSIQEEKIDVHRAILSGRSPVFQKMLQQEGMNETKHNIVDIHDVTMPVLKELVTFMYSGEMKNYDFQTALELYYAADKYEVLDLREVCAHVLMSIMTLADAPKVLNLAELHQDTGLKDKVMQFIKTNY